MKKNKLKWDCSIRCDTTERNNYKKDTLLRKHVDNVFPMDLSI